MDRPKICLLDTNIISGLIKKDQGIHKNILMKFYDEYIWAIPIAVLAELSDDIREK